MEELISGYPPKAPKDSDRQPEGRGDSEADVRRMNQEPQATLDLHGMNSREAEQALENFVFTCRRRGLRKVLIVHGKGHHSQGEPVLQGVVRRYLEKSPYTGAFGSADRKHGGRGATWVMVRRA
jgi:DNA-nicking Smr family endonuclease